VHRFASCTASGKRQLMMPRRSAIGCANKSCRESATQNASKAPSMTDASNCISSRPHRSVLTGWCVQRHGLTRKVSVLRFLRDYRRTIRRPWTPCWCSEAYYGPPKSCFPARIFCPRRYASRRRADTVSRGYSLELLCQ